MSTRAQIRSGVPAWIAYDFVNSILIINGSLHFSAWITGNQGVSSFWYGLTFSVSTLLLLVILPDLGAVIDRLRSGRQILLVISVLMAFCALLLPGVARATFRPLRVVGALLLFGAINFLYQASLVAYNWLLVHLRGVESDQDVRRVSGLGEAAGNCGSVVGAVLGVAVLGSLLAGDSDARIDVLAVAAAVYFILFTIVYLLLSEGIKIRQTALSEGISHRQLVRDAYKAVLTPGPLRRYLLAFLFYADAILTVQLFLPIYMRERIGMTDSASATAFAISLTAAGLGAWMFSRLCRRVDLRAVLLWCLGAWAITLTALGFVATEGVFVGVAAVAGVLFGVLWGASRAYLIQLAPRQMLGRMFGFYAVFERCASIVGPLIWGAIGLLPMSLGTRYRVSFVAMAVLVLVGAIVLGFGQGPAAGAPEGAAQTRSKKTRIMSSSPW